ncbi:MAG: spore cortex biosynthesis protein YabQ [Halothermotrichaceae bacterium]
MTLLYEQFYSFLLMFCFGVGIGIFFIIYQKLINKFSIKSYLLHLLDIIFSILIGVNGLIILVIANRGQFRFYIVLAILLGFSFILVIRKRYKNK